MRRKSFRKYQKIACHLRKQDFYDHYDNTVMLHLCTQHGMTDILPNLRQMDFSSYGTNVISHQWK